MNITIINGPNLNLLGKREPEIYGSLNFEQILSEIRSSFPEITLNYFQSNIEGEIIDHLQENGFKGDGIILNAGGYTHTSVAIADAVASIEVPVIEVHISNIYAREPERQHSLLSSKCQGVICGLGTDVYALAVKYFSGQVQKNK